MPPVDAVHVSLGEGTRYPVEECSAVFEQEQLVHGRLHERWHVVRLKGGGGALLHRSLNVRQFDEGGAPLETGNSAGQ